MRQPPRRAYATACLRESPFAVHPLPQDPRRDDGDEPWPGPDTLVWYQGDGEDTVIGGGGGDTLCVAATGLTLPQLLEAIEVGPGSPQPQLRDGWIDLTGTHGCLVLGGDLLSFRAMERLVLYPEGNRMAG